MPTTVRVYLEQGTKVTFASAIDWPGWSRRGRGDEAALESLLDYAHRYSEVATVAGVRFPARPSLQVVETVPGGTTTDFGAPEMPAAADLEPLSPAALKRQVGLLQASWQVLEAAAAAAPDVLPKGPRGGGRDRDEIVRHVEDAERSYARKVGVAARPFRSRVDVEAMRVDLVAALLAGGGETPWPLAYGIRRIVWHVLDHAWELQDKRT